MSLLMLLLATGQGNSIPTSMTEIRSFNDYYGGSGNDIDDNAAALQLANDDAATSTFYLVVGEGQYKLGSSVNWNPKLNIIGMGAQRFHAGAEMPTTTFKATTSAPMLRYIDSVSMPYATGTIEGIGFDGNSVSTTGLDLGGIQKFNFSKCGFVRFAGPGIKVRGCLVGDFEECFFYLNQYGIDIDKKTYSTDGVMPSNFVGVNKCRFFNQSKWAVKATGDLSMLSVDRCNVEFCGTTGDSDSGAVYMNEAAEGFGLKFTNNYIERISGFAVVKLGVPTSSMVRHVISNNQANVPADTACLHDIYVDATNVSNYHRLELDNNLFRNGTAGLTINGASYDVYRKSTEFGGAVTMSGGQDLELLFGNIYKNGVAQF